jgi:hydrogenase maturation protease
MKAKAKSILRAKEKKPAENERILVLGVGNILLKDDGVGVHIVRELQRRNMPGYISLVDAGSAGLDVLLSADKVRKLVVIDALRAGSEPGTIYRMRLETEQKDELLRIFGDRGNSKISLHQIGLIDALSVVDKMRCSPKEIVIIGVEPEEVNYGLELTNSVGRKILKIINTVLEEIEDAVHK